MLRVIHPCQKHTIVVGPTQLCPTAARSRVEPSQLCRGFTQRRETIPLGMHWRRRQPTVFRAKGVGLLAGAFAVAARPSISMCTCHLCVPASGSHATFCFGNMPMSVTGETDLIATKSTQILMSPFFSRSACCLQIRRLRDDEEPAPACICLFTHETGACPCWGRGSAFLPGK